MSVREIILMVSLALVIVVNLILSVQNEALSKKIKTKEGDSIEKDH